MRRFASVAPIALALSACIPSRQTTAQSDPQGPPVYVNPPPPTTAAPPPPTTTTAPPPPTTTATTPPSRRIARVRPAAVPSGSTATPPAPPAKATSCGDIDVDGVKVPLDCFTKDYAKVTGTASAIARGTLDKAPATAEFVDFRTEGLAGTVRHGQRVGASAAMALAAAIDLALAQKTKDLPPVSALHLFARAPKANLGAVVSANLGRTVAREDVFPWDEARACTWAQPDAARLCTTAEKGKPVTLEDVSKAEASLHGRLVDLVEVDPSSGDVLRSALSRRQGVLLVLRADADAWKSVVKAQETDPLIPDYVGTTAVHSVVVVGFAKQDGEQYFLLKSSWGPSWGAKGFAWIAEPTLKKNAIEAYLVQAAQGLQPVDVATTCPAGQVPDAVTKACGAPCPDKSPKVNGACADPKASCPTGFVQTGGKCVVAAPTTTGSDPSTGISFACGAAGCTYSWKKGTLGCKDDVCSQSCPSPKHLLAVNAAKKTVTCTE